MNRREFFRMVGAVVATAVVLRSVPKGVAGGGTAVPEMATGWGIPWGIPWQAGADKVTVEQHDYYFPFVREG